MTISPDMAFLVGFVCEAFLYGFYTILFALAIYLKLNGPDHQRGLNNPLFIITVLLYLFCSTHFILVFIHFYITLNTTGVEGFVNTKNTLVAYSLLLSITDFLSQLILVYRCWVLWSKNYWVIIFPTLSAFTAVVISAVMTYLLQSTLAQAHGQVPPSLVPLGLASFIVLLCGNANVTALIIVRIWNLSPRKRRDLLGANFPTGTGWAAIVITIESGLLYLVTQTILCVLFAIRHPSEGLMSGIAMPIYGIAPTLIFIRMSGLLNTPSSARSFGLGLSCSGSVSASRPVSTKLAFTHTTTTSTDPSLPKGLTIEVCKSQIERKPSGGDLDSKLSSEDSNIIV